MFEILPFDRRRIHTQWWNCTQAREAELHEIRLVTSGKPSLDFVGPSTKTDATRRYPAWSDVYRETGAIQIMLLGSRLVCLPSKSSIFVFVSHLRYADSVLHPCHSNSESIKFRRCYPWLLCLHDGTLLPAYPTLFLFIAFAFSYIFSDVSLFSL